MKGNLLYTKLIIIGQTNRIYNEGPKVLEEYRQQLEQ